jgi:hypothetical protein
MGDLFFYIAAFVFVIALIVLGAWLWRSMLERGIGVPGNALFKTARDKRIGAIETANIDNRRKLVLIRRDGVEHLIMTGGPVDVVIETGIETSLPYQAPPVGVPQNEQSPYTAPSPSLENRLFSARAADEMTSLRSDD